MRRRREKAAAGSIIVVEKLQQLLESLHTREFLNQRAARRFTSGFHKRLARGGKKDTACGFREHRFFAAFLSLSYITHTLISRIGIHCRIN